MRTVVADTGPLHYLVLIGHADILQQLLGTIHVPEVVRRELTRPGTPAIVRNWVADPPPWVVMSVGGKEGVLAEAEMLDVGEAAAIVLAIELSADLILMDDRAGVAVARRLGFAVTGTLGLLDRAARRGLLDLGAAFAALRNTNFNVNRKLMDAILAEWRAASPR